MKFRIFTNDIATYRFSAFKVISAPDLTAAKSKASGSFRNWAPVKLLVIPETCQELFPDGSTGKPMPGTWANFGVNVL